MNDPVRLADAMRQYIDGHDSAADSICATLASTLRGAAARVLADDDADADDIVQDSLLAFLKYLRRARSAPDNPEAFAATIARNRCYNLRLWRRRRLAADVDELSERLPFDSVSPLDLVEQKQRGILLTETLAQLKEACRRLLSELYLGLVSIEEMRDRLGLQSVQAVYYRRDACLRQAAKILNRRWFNCRSMAGTGGRPEGKA